MSVTNGNALVHKAATNDRCHRLLVAAVNLAVILFSFNVPRLLSVVVQSISFIPFAFKFVYSSIPIALIL